MKLEVRCCCDPNKLLGYLDHPNLQAVGDRWQVVIKHPVESPIDVEFPVFERIELMVMDCRVTGRAGWKPAIRNPDVPIETLKLVPGFEPATFEPAVFDLEAITGHGRY